MIGAYITERGVTLEAHPTRVGGQLFRIPVAINNPALEGEWGFQFSWSRARPTLWVHYGNSTRHYGLFPKWLSSALRREADVVANQAKSEGRQ